MEQETYLERIKKLKSTRKITNDRLSEMTGIPLGTLSKLLAGISDSPKLSNIVAISRALDCSLDWLITGVPENTNNYTLESDEMTLVESYRELDSYGRALTLAVVDMEKARVSRQADEEAIKLHDVARRGARRGVARLRRPEAEGDALDEAAAAFRVTVAEDVPAEAPALPETPAATVATAVAAATVAQLTPADLIRGGATDSEEPAEPTIPRSRLTRSTDLPAGLRRRSIGL